MTEYWPWLVLAGLGAFHGMNPAMGWLFAVALGLHRDSRVILVQALPAIALGHAMSIMIVAGAVVLAGVAISGHALLAGSGFLLIGWAIYHQLYGHRHRVRFGMQTGLAGLALWSFLMATAHGAGLMVLPALIPLCLSRDPLGDIAMDGSVGIALAAVTVAYGRAARRHGHHRHRGSRMARTGRSEECVDQLRRDLDRRPCRYWRFAAAIVGSGLTVVADLLVEERAGGRALRQLQLERDRANAAGAFAAHQQAFVLAGAADRARAGSRPRRNRPR